MFSLKIPLLLVLLYAPCFLAGDNKWEWITILRRTTGKLDFDRTWEEYKQGFSDADGEELWLGNQKVHELVMTNRYELRIDMKAPNQPDAHANYKFFAFHNETNDYKLLLNYGNFTGVHWDALLEHNGVPFTTKDRNNAKSPYRDCAQKYRGGWWYKPVVCYRAAFTGLWPPHPDARSKWLGYDRGLDTMTFVEMKIRRLN